MYLTLWNGEREVFDGFWKPATRYLIDHAKREFRRANLLVDMFGGFIVGLVMGAVITNLLDRVLPAMLR